MKADPKSVRVCLVAIHEVMASTLMGLYDVLNSLNLLGTYGDGLAGRAHFKAEIVATTAGALSSASGVPVEARRSIKQIDSADVIIIPSQRLVVVRLGFTPDYRTGVEEAVVEIIRALENRPVQSGTT